MLSENLKQMSVYTMAYFKMYLSDNYMYCLCALYAMSTVTEDSKENGEIIVKFFLCIYRYEISGSFKLAIVFLKLLFLKFSNSKYIRN